MPQVERLLRGWWLLHSAETVRRALSGGCGPARDVLVDPLMPAVGRGRGLCWSRRSASESATGLLVDGDRGT